MAAENKGLFLSYSTAKKLATDIKFYQTNYPVIVDKANICEQQLSNKDNEIDTCKKLNDSYIIDKQDLTKVSSDFQKKYTDANAMLADCKSSKPSRMTWFGIGVATSLVTGLVTAFLTR